MADFGSLVQSAEFWLIVGFHVFIILMLALDLGVFQRKSHAVTMKEAGAWTSVWVSLALLFAAGIWQFWHRWYPDEPNGGAMRAGLFLAGYGIELSLSVDNLFVFLVIFRYFAVPPHLQHRVLFWGIVGALIMRASFILIGVALLHAFHWMMYVFGAFLVYTGYKLLRSVEEEIDPGRNPLLRLARRLFPVLDSYESDRFWVKRDGRWYATPLPLVLLVVESTDVVFAIDSIPAILGIFPNPKELTAADTFIAYTSNIFAILGLRSLFFLLANFLGMFRYLSIGLAIVLAFIGVKMLIADWYKVPIGWSLAAIGTILGVAVVASLLAGPKEPLEHPPEAVAYNPPDGNAASGAGSQVSEPPVGNP
jgi:tellurite resistance protein TerC